MRSLALALLLSCVSANAAFAWAFAQTEVCTVTHDGADMSVVLTFDPAAIVYTITLIRPDTIWPESDNFRLRFDGPRPLIIGTDRHERSDDGRRLSVSDSGFGNVLDGIQFNGAMIAIAGEDEIGLSTADSGEAMQAFRACPATPVS